MIKFLFEPKKAFRSFTQLIVEDCVRKKSSESTAFLSGFCKMLPKASHDNWLLWIQARLQQSFS